MAKGWVKLNTVNDITYNNNRGARAERDNNFNLLIKNTKTPSIKKLKEDSEKLYAQQKAEDDKLLDAFEKNILKSKTAIKRALQLKKERAKLEKKDSKSTEQNTNTDSTAEESKESNV